jgi:hypothetical protein
MTGAMTDAPTLAHTLLRGVDGAPSPGTEAYDVVWRWMARQIETWAIDMNGENARKNWADLRSHVTTIAEAGARNDERQALFEELRAMMARMEAMRP